MFDPDNCTASEVREYLGDLVLTWEIDMWNGKLDRLISVHGVITKTLNRPWSYSGSDETADHASEIIAALNAVTDPNESIAHKLIKRHRHEMGDEQP